MRSFLCETLYSKLQSSDSEKVKKILQKYVESTTAHDKCSTTFDVLSTTAVEGLRLWRSKGQKKRFFVAVTLGSAGLEKPEFFFKSEVRFPIYRVRLVFHSQFQTETSAFTVWFTHKALSTQKCLTISCNQFCFFTK